MAALIHQLTNIINNDMFFAGDKKQARELAKFMIESLHLTQELKTDDYIDYKKVEVPSLVKLEKSKNPKKIYQVITYNNKDESIAVRFFSDYITARKFYNKKKRIRIVHNAKQELIRQQIEINKRNKELFKTNNEEKIKQILNREVDKELKRKTRKINIISDNGIITSTTLGELEHKKWEEKEKQKI